MNDGKITEIIDKVRAEIAREGLSQAAAATGIGISDAALSQWLRGKYEGDSGVVAEKARRWLATQSERRDLLANSPAPPTWAATPLAKRAMAALAHAHLAADMCAVYGAPGLGKTISARRYAGLRPNVWIATATRATRSVTGTLRQVADAMQLRSAPRRAADLESAAVERMRGSGGLLIVDEAQHLPTASLEELRSLHDASGCGLALVGSDPLWLRLSAGRHPELAQLYSRVGKRVRLGGVTAADTAALLSAWAARGGPRVQRRPDRGAPRRAAEPGQGALAGSLGGCRKGRHAEAPARRLARPGGRVVARARHPGCLPEEHQERRCK